MPPDEAHAPMEMTHFGSGIWSYTRFSTGAILRDSRPATIITSAWRGLARNTSEPKRARSCRVSVDAIISMAQQARPNVTGQRLLLLPQATSLVRFVNRIPSDSSSCQSFSKSSFRLMPVLSFPSEYSLAEHVNVADCQDRHEDDGVREQKLRLQFETHRKRVKECDLQVEDDEQHRDHVEVHRKALARVSECGDA